MPATPEITWFRSLHYGGTHAVLWWAILPNGVLHLRSELVQPGLIRDLATAIKARTRRLSIEAIRYTVADHEAMSGTTKRTDDGETRADTFRANGITIRESTHDVAQGWTRIAELLGLHLLSIHPSCAATIRALSTAATDPTDAELIQASGHDPILNALRMGAMSRPAPKPDAKRELPKNAVGRLVDEIRSGSHEVTLAWK
jgi:hypothetical protein